MALRLRDLFIHPARRGVSLSTGQKDSRAMALDAASRMSTIGYGLASPKFKDYSSYLSAYRLPWVRACTQVISYNAANIAFRLVKPGSSGSDEEEDQEILDSPFLNLFNHPNPYQTGFELREAWWTDLELTGNAYISLEGMTPRGLPTEMYRINPSRVTILPDRQTFIRGYAYTVNGRSVEYEPSEIIHLKYANPIDDFYGMGVIEAGEARFESEMAMAEHERRFWQSGAKITGVLQSAGELDQSRFDRIVNNIRSFFQGSGYSTMLLENGLTYQSVSDGPAKLGMLDMALASRDQILAMFGVPATKLGILEKANYKADEADRYFFTETIEPKLTRVEDSMQPLVDLFHPGQDYRLRFKRLDFSDDLPQMLVAKAMADVGVFSADEIRQYTGHDPLKEHGDTIIAQVGIVPLDLAGPMATVNERRSDLGLPPMEGGDAYIILPGPSWPRADPTGAGAPDPGQPAQPGEPSAPGAPPPAPGASPAPSNVVRLPRGAPSTPPTPPAPVAEATAKAINDAVHDSLTSKAVNRVSVRAPATAHLMRQHQQRALSKAEQHVPALKAFFGAQRTRVLARLAGYSKRAKATITAAGLWDDDEEDDALRTTLDPLWTDALTAGVAAAQAVGVPVRGESDARMARLTTRLADRVTNINDTTRTAIADVVGEGLRRGYSSRQIADGNPDEDYDGISGVFEEASDTRAILIARTEMTKAYNSANLDAYRESGVVDMVELADGDYDEVCAARDGQIVTLEDAEAIDEHPNGTLALLPLIGGGGGGGNDSGDNSDSGEE